MLSTDLALSSAFADPATDMARMLVTRRRPSDRAYEAVGYLDRMAEAEGGESFLFSYLRSAVERGISPVIGFSDLGKTYRSPRLFPSFAERVISAKRPDRAEYLKGLRLTESANSWEILGASGGHREGDPIELIPLPTYMPSTGFTEAHFLAHAVRHVPGASEAISSLATGDELTFAPEPTNVKDPCAIQILSGSASLGYVPAPLTEYVHSVLDDGAPYVASVVKANSAEAHPHLRLLLRLDGRCAHFVFDDPAWSVM